MERWRPQGEGQWLGDVGGSAPQPSQPHLRSLMRRRDIPALQGSTRTSSARTPTRPSTPSGRSSARSSTACSRRTWSGCTGKEARSVCRCFINLPGRLPVLSPDVRLLVLLKRAPACGWVLFPGGDGQLLFRGYGSASLYSVIIKGFLEPARQPWSGAQPSRFRAVFCVASSAHSNPAAASAEEEMPRLFLFSAAVLGVCHRIAVFDYDDSAVAMKITDIVSQSDMIRRARGGAPAAADLH